MTRLYDISGGGGSVVDRFRTGPAGGRSADEVAIGHLIEHSAWHRGTFRLWFVDVPGGCRFRPRCWLRTRLGDPAVCTTDDPELRSVGPVEVACHFPDA